MALSPVVEDGSIPTAHGPNWATAQLTIVLRPPTAIRASGRFAFQAATRPGGLTYHNFDLMFEGLDQGYQARVVNSPMGLATTIFVLQPSILDLSERLSRVGGAGQAYQSRQEDTNLPHPVNPEQFGRELYETVFSGEVGMCLRRSLDLARSEGAGLRIRLHLNDAPELVALPWEFLYNSLEGRFFALSEETPLVRYTAQSHSVSPLSVQLPPLRLLVMVSDPVDSAPQLQLDDEWKRLVEALADLQRRGQIVVERIPATLSGLQRRLREAECHIFHFIGRSWLDERKGEAGLVLEDARGAGHWVAAEQFSVLFHLQDSLRLVFLNTDNDARGAGLTACAGVAQHLVQQGIPAAIAIQFPISDRTAFLLAEEFYGALVDGAPVDTALNAARKAMFISGSSLEWGAPALFSRANDNQIFNLPDQFSPSDSTSPSEIAVWQRQLDHLRADLRLIEEREAEFVLASEIPLQLRHEKENILAKIVELDAHLAQSSTVRTRGGNFVDRMTQ